MSDKHYNVTQVAVSIPFDNSTDGFTSTNVQAAIEEGVNKNITYEVTSTSVVTTTSNTPAVITGMSYTPPAGQYLAIFSCSINSNTAGAVCAVALYNGGTQDTNTVRYISPFDGGALSASSANGVVAINKVVTVASGAAVEIWWNTNGGTMTCSARTLNLIRIG